MHFFGIALFLAQIAFAIHAIRRNEWNWAFMIIFLPLIGCILYGILVILPEVRNSRSVRRANRTLQDRVDPRRHLRDRAQKLDTADTVENRSKMADELLQNGQAREALELYESALCGIHATDPDLMLGLARACFASGDYARTRQTLDELIRHNPDYRSEPGHLLYARALEELNEVDAAREEYAALSAYATSLEALWRYGVFLKKQGQPDRARECFEKIVKNSQQSASHFNSLNREWIAAARAEL